MDRTELKLLPAAPYQKMYTVLFNAITDALDLLEENSQAAACLKLAQQKTEDLYISQK